MIRTTHHQSFHNRWNGFKDEVEQRKKELEELKLMRFVLDDQLAGIDVQLYKFKKV